MDAETFEQVQERRRERAESLGRRAQLNSYANKVCLETGLYAESAGSLTEKYVCSTATSREKPSDGNANAISTGTGCTAGTFFDGGTDRGCHPCGSQLFYRKSRFAGSGVTVLKTELESAQSRKLTGQIQECLENGQYSADAIRQLVFERARAQYQEAAIDDSGFRTES
ncbi:MAG: hypothetical protein ACLR0U_25800 [Enterocloster clostridioformis]